MRITYAGNFEWPSEQARAIQTIHTCHALARAGADVTLLTMRPATPGPALPQALARYGLAPHPRFWARSVRTLTVPDAFEWIEIHKRLAVTNISYSLAAAVGIVSQPRVRRPDWIYTRDPRVAWTFIRLRRLTGARVVYEVHELFGMRPRDNRSLDQAEQWGVATRTRALEATVLERADRLITLTDACRRIILEDHQVAPGRVHVIADGTRDISPEPQRAPGSRHVMYVGQLYRWKGVDTLIRAMAELPDTCLSVIGSGVREGGKDMDRMRLEALAAELGLIDRVHFESFIPYEEVSDRLATADVATVPLPDVLMSRYFTSPLKLFDAMAAGTPIVASNLDSIREVIRDGKNGILVEPDSPAALAAGIRRILDNPDVAVNLAAQARQDAAAFTWEARAAKIVSVLSSAG